MIPFDFPALHRKGKWKEQRYLAQHKWLVVQGKFGIFGIFQISSRQIIAKMPYITFFPTQFRRKMLGENNSLQLFRRNDDSYLTAWKSEKSRIFRFYALVYNDTTNVWFMAWYFFKENRTQSPVTVWCIKIVSEPATSVVYSAGIILQTLNRSVSC